MGGYIFVIVLSVKKVTKPGLFLIVVFLGAITALLYLQVFDKSQVSNSLSKSVDTNDTKATLGNPPDIKYADYEPPPFPGMDTSFSGGTIKGKLCYPSEGVPPLDIYVKNMEDGAVLTLSTKANQGTYLVEKVPVGLYVIFAYPKNSNFGGLYSPAVACGLSVDCTDHSPSIVKVEEGKTVENIDICDWYGNKVPSRP
ncbi:MAG: hypothetical protein AAB443_03595 [Patescibacteria group bacterium]